MTVLVDAGPIAALADRSEPRHADVAAFLLTASEDLLIPQPVLAEIDYLLDRRFGPAARRVFLRDLRDGRYSTACLDTIDFASAERTDTRYADLNLGLADLSLIVLAQRYDTRRVLTFDQRHLRAVEPIQGGAFTLLPYDEPG